MKNMSRIVALILSASAGLWLTGCAAELGDANEDTDSALANVEKGVISKGHLGGGQAGISGISKERGLGGQFEGGMLGKGAPVSGGTQAGERGLGGQVGGQVGGQAGGQVGGQAGGQLGGQVGGQVGGQAAYEERFEETQGAGIGGQLADQGLRHEESAGQAAEGDTAASQEALSTQWWGYGPWRYGYGFYPRRFFYGGYYPYYGGYPYYGYGYGYGCGGGWGGYGCW